VHAKPSWRTRSGTYPPADGTDIVYHTAQESHMTDDTPWGYM
jgi:hypothetical protein